MFDWLLLLCSALMAASPAATQARAGASPDATLYAVAYVETTVSSAKAAAAALGRYRDAVARQDGFLKAEFFEQVGRPAHFAIVESWRDQNAFEARSAAQQQLLDALQPIRVSGYDQRPYKPIAISPSGRTDRETVFVITHVDVAPNPQVAVMLRRLAEASRLEAGNLRFDVLQHTMRANHFTVIEAWRNQQALGAHVAASHTRLYRDELQPLTGSPLDERVYRIGD